MRSDQLQRWQLAKIQRSMEPALKYLHRLHDRMHTVGFPPGDPLFDLVTKTREDCFRLDMLLRQLLHDNPAVRTNPEQLKQGETRPEQLARWERASPSRPAESAAPADARLPRFGPWI